MQQRASALTLIPLQALGVLFAPYPIALFSRRRREVVGRDLVANARPNRLTRLAVELVVP
jgi:hypothetical protein